MRDPSQHTTEPRADTNRAESADLNGNYKFDLLGDIRSLPIPTEPIWFSQLKWHGPFAVQELVSGNHKEWIDTKGSGLYAFTRGKCALKSGEVLYIGKSGGKTPTLRGRLSVYIRRFRRPNGPRSKHKGLERLCDYFRTKAHFLHVQWAGCVIAEELEGRLIDFYGPEFNNRDEEIRFCDDELIHPDYLPPQDEA